MNPADEYRRAAAGALSKLAKEIALLLTDRRPSRHAQRLRTETLAAGKGLSAGTMQVGEAARTIVSGARAYMSACRQSGRLSRIDARLGRAAARYADEELKAAFGAYPEGVPEAVLLDPAIFRVELAEEYLLSGYLVRPEDGGATAAWTASGIEAAEAPAPPEADDEGLSPKDRLYPA